jgi:hypothetical protein
LGEFFRIAWGKARPTGFSPGDVLVEVQVPDLLPDPGGFLSLACGLGALDFPLLGEGQVGVPELLEDGRDLLWPKAEPLRENLWF